MTYREPGQAGTLLLAPLPCPAHVGAGGALGGQRTAATAQALRRTRRTRVTLPKEMINTFKTMSAGKSYHVCWKSYYVCWKGSDTFAISQTQITPKILIQIKTIFQT